MSHHASSPRSLALRLAAWSARHAAAPTLALVALVGALLAGGGWGCGGDKAGGNTAPTAVIAAVQPVPQAGSVALDGSGSTDPEDDALTYAWRMVSVPLESAVPLGTGAFTPAGGTTASTAFTADVIGDYVVELVVRDPSLPSAPARATVHVGPIATMRLDVISPTTSVGYGTVTSAAWSISCYLDGSSFGVGSCGADVPNATVVTLTATPAAGNTFQGWTLHPPTAGSCPGTTATCQVTVTETTAVEARFQGPAPAPTSAGVRSVGRGLGPGALTGR